MKILVLILVLFLSVYTTYSSPCKIFKCGNIEQKSGEETKCVDAIDSNDYKAESCNSQSQHCESKGWTTVVQAAIARCRNNTSDETENFSAPGDYCSDAKYCFGDNKEKKCKNNVCTTTKVESSDCPDDEGNPGHKWCPLGHYCDNNRKCAKQVGKGEPCPVGEACSFGYSCTATNDQFDDYKCYELHSLENSNQFDVSRFIQGGSEWVGYNSFCKSYHYVDVDGEMTRKECRAGDKSLNITSEADYRRDGDGKECLYETPNATHPHLTLQGTDTSKCGFNTNNYGYCLVRKGDEYFMSRREKFANYAITKLKCHPQSSILTCNDFMNMDKDVMIDFTQATLAVDKGYGYPLIAKNDKCVAQTITTRFWKGRSPDSALGFASLSAVSFILMTITYLL